MPQPKYIGVCDDGTKRGGSNFVRGHPHRRALHGNRAEVLRLSDLAVYFAVDALVGEKHAYDGALREVNPETTRDRMGFVEHFVRVARSTQEEGGWQVHVDMVRRCT